MNKDLMQATARLLEAAEHTGLTLDGETNLPYGVQLTFRRSNDTAAVNLYFSAKKGLSAVMNGKKTSPLHAVLQALTDDLVRPRLHEWTRWMGTDESGKGDYFGPLVTSGFVADDGALGILRELQVQDCKRMTDAAVRRAGAELERRCARRCETIALLPAKYNALYGDFRSQGRNLNDLLAWMHARVIANLAERFTCEGVIIDRFAHPNRIKKALRTSHALPLVGVEKGERDPAVAAASVLARYHFLLTMDDLSASFGMTLPKGAGAPVDSAAAAFVRQFSFDRLGDAAKLHFANTNKLPLGAAGRAL